MTTNIECSICLECINNSDNIYKLNCDHCFHRNCIKKWLNKKSSCPLCRTHVDADHRYVDDGILTAERLLYIENLRAVCLWTSTGLEWLFPNSLNGYTQLTQQMLDSEQGQRLLETSCIEQYNSIPKNLLLELGLNGLTKFILNGGLTNL